MIELALDDEERVLDHGDDAVDLRVDGMQVAAFRRLAHDTPDLARPFGHSLSFGADIALVGSDRGLLAVEKLIPCLAVVQLRG